MLYDLLKLLVVNVLWKVQLDLCIVLEVWIIVGGVYYIVFSYVLNFDDMCQFVELYDIELIVIDNDICLLFFKDVLCWNEVYYGLKC